MMVSLTREIVGVGQVELDLSPYFKVLVPGPQGKTSKDDKTADGSSAKGKSGSGDGSSGTSVVRETTATMTSVPETAVRSGSTIIQGVPDVYLVIGGVGFMFMLMLLLVAKR